MKTTHEEFWWPLEWEDPTVDDIEKISKLLGQPIDTAILVLDPKVKRFNKWKMFRNTFINRQKILTKHLREKEYNPLSFLQEECSELFGATMKKRNVFLQINRLLVMAVAFCSDGAKYIFQKKKEVE